MPLGDSLTAGLTSGPAQGGYRNQLYDLLTTAAYEVDFVGTFSDSNNPTLPDVNHQGLGGARIDQIQANLGGWLNAVADPDVVLLLAGTNDIWQNFSVATAPARLRDLIADIAVRRPLARIIVSNLPRRIDDPNLEAQQAVFNAYIPGIVMEQIALGRRVWWLDMHPVLLPGDFSADGVHPITTGYQKMADAWARAVTAVITPSGGPAPPPNLIVNGGFESDLAGWTTGGSVRIESGSPYVPTDGTKVLAFNSGNQPPNGVLSQTFPTTPGRIYQLGFNAGVLAYNTNPQRLLLNVQGSSPLVSDDIPLIGPGGGATTWIPKGYVFTANSSTTTVTFSDLSMSTFNIDLLVDTVRVVDPSAAEPIGNNGFTSWLAAHGFIAAPGTDTDQDSLGNAVEYVVGGNPLNVMDAGLLPTASLVVADPLGSLVMANYFLFTYRRTERSKNDSATSMKVQWGTDPAGPWTTADGAHGEITIVGPNEAGPGIDLVRVYLPADAGGRLFARLNVTVDVTP